MEIRFRLHHETHEVSGNEAHLIQTHGRQLVMIKLPVGDMLPEDMTDFVQKQATAFREFFGEDQTFLVVPIRYGDDAVCEMSLVSPNLDDLRECIRALSDAEKRKLLDDLLAERKAAAPEDDDFDDWGHIGNST